MADAATDCQQDAYDNAYDSAMNYSSYTQSQKTESKNTELYRGILCILNIWNKVLGDSKLQAQQLQAGCEQSRIKKIILTPCTAIIYLLLIIYLPYHYEYCF
jgi:hypothetical protein